MATKIILNHTHSENPSRRVGQSNGRQAGAFHRQAGAFDRQAGAFDRQAGATLIEILVSLLVFSIGALGIAALQTASIVRTDDTKQRSVAIWKAQELLDRMRATKTSARPQGRLDLYVAAIANDNSDNGIGVLDATDSYTCPAQAPDRCDLADDTQECTVYEPKPVDADGVVDENAETAEIPDQSAQKLVNFDVWSIFCDPHTGLVPNTVEAGSTGLRQLEVSMEQTGGAYNLYFEWLSRSSNNNLDDAATGANAGTGLQNADGSARTVTTNLCGADEAVDTRLDVYCVRFE